MTLKFTALPGYTSRENKMNDQLNELFAKWYAYLKAGAAGRFDPATFIPDGFYPQYTTQKKKILFIGREGLWEPGANYIDLLYGWYTNKDDTKNDDHKKLVNGHKFHRLLLKISYGLNHGCLPWAEIPDADKLTETFGVPGGFSFAFMNLSKLSNATEHWRLTPKAVNDFLECSNASGDNFFNREISIFEPNLIITMNFRDKWLNSLGECKTLPAATNQLGQNLLEVNGRETLLLNAYHFSAVNKSDQTAYYDLYRSTVFWT